MKVKLYGGLGSLVLIAEVKDAPPVLVWGTKVYVKDGKRKYRETRHEVLHDTGPDPWSFPTVRD